MIGSAIDNVQLLGKNSKKHEQVREGQREKRQKIRMFREKAAVDSNKYYREYKDKSTET